MKNLIITLTIAITALLSVSTAFAQVINTGPANSNTTVINCVNQTNTNNCPPPANNPGSTPTPGNPGNPGNPGGGPGGSGGGSDKNCTLGAPGDTTLVSVVKTGTNSVKLSWTAASGATDYVIEYGQKSNSYTYGVPSTGNVTSYTIGSLDLSKAYFFRVIALNGCRQGNASNEVSTAFGGAILGLSNTSSSDNSFLILAAAILLGSAGAALLVKGIRDNA